ncbi:tetraspanin Tsp2 family [Mycena alexandri]|uniref:Tetraspanin Tsp2 family n=1 Tax=Mycena alexandri TaxID=1745969 RepID=A0AAD6TJI1_9AGAR|nr:tetraspanin Tsp2 family [Mycena alexandri]
MEYRAPSSFPSGGLRRRSGAYSQLEDEVEDDVPLTSDSEDEPHLHRKPTVLLVRRAPPAPHLPSLPGFLAPATSPRCSFRSTSPPFSPLASSPVVERAFTLTLTPRPDVLRRSHSDAPFQSTATTPTIPSLPTPNFGSSPRLDAQQRADSDSDTLPPLPTPDFTRPARFLSIFPRGLSFLSSASRPSVSRTSSSAKSSESAFSDPVASQQRQSRPQSARSDSEGRSSGRSIAGSGYSNSDSIDSGHHALIKFTHKWPRPRSLRSYSEEDVADAASVSLLEDGRGPGLGMDSEPWTGFKWCLLLSVWTVFVYGAAALVCALMTWFRTWDQADVMTVADNDVLVLITLAGSILVFTSLVGLSGVLLNSRPILAVYTLLLWPAFASLVAIGYLAYKRATFALDHKLNMAWSQYYTPLGRLFIQNALRCCGFYSALHEATPSKRCFPRTALPGCKGKLYRFERANLALVWETVFALVPLHLLNVLVALVCANHVTERFGRGVTPERYRLTRVDVQADAEKIMRMGPPGRLLERSRGGNTRGVCPPTFPEQGESWTHIANSELDWLSL